MPRSPRSLARAHRLALPRLALPRLIFARLILPRLIFARLILPRRILPRLILPRLIFARLALPRLALPRFILAPLVALAACGRAQAPEPRWEAAPPLLHPRAAHAVVSAGDALYAIAGTGRDGAPVLPIERFDGAAWREVSTLPGPGLNAPAAVAIDRRIFVIGGFDTTTNIPSDRVMVFDLDRGEWSESTPLPAPRGGHAAAVLDGEIHVLGGGNQRSTLADHDVFDPTAGAWRPRAPLPRSEGSPAAVVHRGVLHAIGGRSGPADFGAVDRYDAAADRWTEGPPIPPRATVGAALVCGELHVFGGESQARRATLDEALRLVDDARWEPIPAMPTARAFARAAIFDGDVHVVGGTLTPQVSHAPEGSAVVERLRVKCRE
ncbi:MAG: kelch repeat-containing protein [Nannocystaceae bacterium]